MVAWAPGDNEPTQVPYDPRLIPFHDLQPSFGLYNDSASHSYTSWPRKTALHASLATTALHLHCPDVILPEYMAHATHYPRRAERCRLYLLQSVRFAEPTVEERAFVGERRIYTYREKASLTRYHAEDEGGRVVLPRTTVEA